MEALLEPVIGDNRFNFTASEVDAMVLRFWADATGCDTSFVANEDYLLSWGQ